MNYKVKVNNEVESREVQELFEQLGLVNKDWSDMDFPKLISNHVTGEYSDYPMTDCIINQYKELTIQQLKDLVVLKRNSIDDATHEDCKRNVWFVSGDDKYMMQDSAWELRGDAPLLLKPIINPPKEYLRMNNDGEYVLEVTGEREAQEPHAKNWIEVPKGCDYLVSVSGVNSFIEESMIHKVKSNKSFERVLWQRDKEKEIKEYLVPQDNGKYALTKATEKRVSDWVEIDSDVNFVTVDSLGGIHTWSGIGLELNHFKGDSIVWQRHTQPEELQFVDDEPKSLNDTYAEIEQVRQDNVNNPSHYSDSSIECIDAMEAMMTPEQFIGYLRGNVFKYQWRYEKKNGIEDLKKAQWYLDKLVTKVNEK